MEPICIKKTIQAPVARVFQAWSSAEMMERWFFPDSSMNCEATCDFRVNGRYQVLMRDDEKEYPHSGEYREIIDQKRIVFTWSSHMVKDTLVTIDFNGNDRETQITLTHDLFKSEEEVTAHQKGWAGCLGNFEACLAS